MASSMFGRMKIDLPLSICGRKRPVLCRIHCWITAAFCLLPVLALASEIGVVGLTDLSNQKDISAFRNGTNPLIQVIVDEVNASQGETVLIGVNVFFPGDTSFISSEMRIGGYWGDLNFLEIVTESSLISQAGWSLEYNEKDSLLEIASAGSDGISGEGVLFWLKFSVPNTVSGFVPITLENASFNTDDIFVEMTSGGVNIVAYSGPIWHVSTIGSDETGNGSEGNPFATIQYALNSANSGNRVLVYEGGYSENIEITKPISLVSNSGPQSTTISASYASAVISMGDIDEPVEIEGFTIRDGYRSDEGGSGIESSNIPYLTIENCILTNNYAESPNAWGGTILISGYVSNVRILDTRIVNNSASNGGGGGLRLGDNDVPVKLERVLIANNQGDAIHVNDGMIEITNCTITNNLYGITLNRSLGTIWNSILFYNYIPEIELIDFSSASVSYSDISGGYSGEENISSAPQFVDPGTVDFHLQPNSPCIDEGDPDLDGDGLSWEIDPDDQDPDGSRMDMGAYFYNKSILPYILVSSDSLHFESEQALLYLYIENEGSGELNWFIEENISWLDVFPESSPLTSSLNDVGKILNSRSDDNQNGVKFINRHQLRTGSVEISKNLSIYGITSSVDTVAVLVNRTGMPTGIYRATFFVTSNGGDRTIYVHMEVGLSNTAPTIFPFYSGEEQSDTVAIMYVLQDPEGDTLSLAIKFSYGDTSSWYQATVPQDLTLIMPEDYQGQLHWLTSEDLPKQDVETLLKFTVWDKVGSTEEIISVHVDNYGGEVIIDPLFEEVGGDVEIVYTIVDPWGDEFTLSSQYLDPYENVWRSATILGEVVGIGPDDYDGSLNWQTGEDLPTFEGSVLFTILLHDGLQFGVSDTIIIAVDNVAPPQLGNYQPVEFDLVSWWINDISLTFTRGIDVNFVSSAITIDGNVSGEQDFSFDYDPVAHELVLHPITAFAALETVTVTITPDLVDSAGIPFDGNSNGDVDDPEEDVFSWQFETTVLGDYTLDKMVNYNDLALFREAWLDSLLHQERDIGPAIGDLPQLILTPDGVFNFEDLMVFAQMWNWSYEQGFYEDSTLALIKHTVKDNPVHLVLDPGKDTPWNPMEKQTISIAICIDNFSSLGVFGLEFKFDPGVLAFHRIESNLDNPWIIFDHFDADENRLVIAGALLSNRSPEHSYQTVVSLHFDKLKEAKTEIIHSATLWTLEGDKMIYPLAVSRFNMETSVPKQFALHQNFPNPFNPITTIRYEVPRESHIQVGIFNLLGQEIITLVNERQLAGYYQISWGGKDNSGQTVGSGVYFVVLRAETFTTNKKMLLIK